MTPEESRSWLTVPKFFSSMHLRSRRHAKPGSHPGAIVVDPDAPTPQITVIQYNRQSYSKIDDLDPRELVQQLKPDTITWVNVDGLGSADIIRQIGNAFSIHSLALEDIVNVHQRAKVEQYDDHLFIVARMLTVDDGHLGTEQVSLVMGKNYVVTFQETPGDCLDGVRKRLQKSTGRVRSAGADYLAYAILDAIVDGYFPVLDEYSEQLDILEEQLTTHKAHHLVSAIHKVRSDYYMIRKAIWPHREMLNTLIRDMNTWFDKETHTYLRDCYDHIVQIVEIVETSREIASDIRDFHFTQISIRQNEIMKVLTVISSVFIPLSFVTGLYGMNFDVQASPYNMPELHWAYGYPAALCAMGTIALAMLIFFWKLGWLRR